MQINKHALEKMTPTSTVPIHLRVKIVAYFLYHFILAFYFNLSNAASDTDNT